MREFFDCAIKRRLYKFYKSLKVNEVQNYETLGSRKSGKEIKIKTLPHYPKKFFH